MMARLLRHRLRVRVAGALPLALLALTLTGTSALGAQSSRPAAPADQGHSPAPQVGSLTAEHMTDPLGIDSGQPLLGWVISSAVSEPT